MNVREWGNYAWFIAIVLAMALGLSVVLAWKFTTPELALPIAMVFGVIGLLATLSAISIIFAGLGMSDSTQALGLPPDSLRAAIAFSLILIFASLATFLYWQVKDSENRWRTAYKGISQDFMLQLKIPPDQIVGIQSRIEKGPDGEKIVFDVQRQVEPVTGQDSVKFAQQLLTTISTLVVAVAGFYFGTRSVAAARDASEARTIRLLRPTESPVTLGDAKGTPLSIRVETSPPGMAVRGIVEGDESGTLDQVAHDEFEYRRGTRPTDTVTLRFPLAVRPDVSVEVKVVKPTTTSTPKSP